jgi:hypothetical protein
MDGAFAGMLRRRDVTRWLEQAVATDRAQRVTPAPR